jgi:NDP-sugar pyrophosphorylase family protein
MTQVLSFLFQAVYNFLKDSEDNLGVKITCSQNTEPLGTDKFVDGSGEPLFVLNCGVISEYSFAELIRFHKSHGGEATIMVKTQNAIFISISLHKQNSEKRNRKREKNRERITRRAETPSRPCFQADAPPATSLPSAPRAATVASGNLDPHASLLPPPMSSLPVS